MPIRNVSIRAKLIGAFSLLLLFLGGLSGVGLYSSARLNGLLMDVQTNWLPSMRTAGQIDALTGRYVTSLMRHILTQDPQILAGVEKDLRERGQKLDQASKAYEALISSPEERTLYETFTRDWRVFSAVVEPIVALSRKGDKAQALALYETKGVSPRRSASTALDKIVALNQDGASRAEADSRDTYAQTRTLVGVAGLLALLLALALMVLIVRSISQGIRSVVGPMRALAEGDLAVSVPHRGARTEIGTIADAVQIFKDRLIQMRDLEAATVAARTSAAEERRRSLRDMADGFERAVGGIIGTVTAAATELQQTAQGMAGTATQTAERSMTVAAAAEEASTNVNTVAAAAEELGSSVQEISRQVDGSASLAQNAVAEAGQTALWCRNSASPWRRSATW